MSEYEVTVRFRVETPAEDGLRRLMATVADDLNNALAATTGVIKVGRGPRAEVVWVDAPEGGR